MTRPAKNLWEDPTRTLGSSQLQLLVRQARPTKHQRKLTAVLDELDSLDALHDNEYEAVEEIDTADVLELLDESELYPTTRAVKPRWRPPTELSGPVVIIDHAPTRDADVPVVAITPAEPDAAPPPATAVPVPLEIAAVVVPVVEPAPEQPRYPRYPHEPSSLLRAMVVLVCLGFAGLAGVIFALL